MGFYLEELVPGMSRGQFDDFSARYFEFTKDDASDISIEAFKSFHRAEFGPLVGLYDEAIQVVSELDISSFVRLDTEAFVRRHVEEMLKAAELRKGTELGFVLALMARDYRLGICDLERSGWEYIYEYGLTPDWS